MDPRHPQHPFNRSAQSPYAPHVPFQQQQQQQQQQGPQRISPPFPQGADPRAGPPQFRPDHQRRASENNYFPQPAYSRDSAPMPNADHARTGSSSSMGAGPGSMNRSMPPPSSPQQREPQQQQQQQQVQGHSKQSRPHFPPPPPSRQPAPAIGPPTPFATGRDLPALNPMHRPNSVNSSSMSISSMLGGPARQEQGPPGPPYQSPAAMMLSGAPTGPTTPFTPSIQHHASPRISTAGSDYDRFRRPQTPEHHRLSQSQMSHPDARANSVSAGSPHGPVLTPDKSLRYSTPQAYPRNPSGSGPTIPEERREQYPATVRVPNPNVLPPRPSSQPALFNQPPREREPSNAETIRSDNGRSQPYVPRSSGYGNRDDIPAFRERERIEEAILKRDREREQQQREREMEHNRNHEREREMLRERESMRQRETEREYRERERERERERDIMRERERQEREREMMRERERERMERARDPAAGFARQEQMQPQYARQYGPQPGTFGPRELEGPWMRRVDEHPREPMQQPGPPPYDYPGNGPHPYGATPAYPHVRYPAPEYQQREQQMQQQQQQQQQVNGAQYGSPLQERERMHGPHQMQQQQYGPQGPQGPFRPNEEMQHNMQRGVYLGIQQEINRKGRNSPFPQAVQGAQGPPGEPGIKSEFGKMFSGIGSGVGSIGGSGASGGTQTPYQGGLRREDLEGVAAFDSPTEMMARQDSRGGRRRKLQDDDKDDSGSTGRRTPTGRKRAKPTPQLDIGAHRHVSGPEPITRLSSPSQPSLTPTFGQHMGPSPPRKVVPHHHHVKVGHHHHHNRNSPFPAQQPQVIVPKPKQVVKSNAVLESVAHLPRKHLGHFMYEASLTPGDPPSLNANSELPRRGYSSNAKPLPKDVIEDKQGCTLTVRVPRVYLDTASREEITMRRGLWGTDVYTDDSDVIAACIHSGWIQGAWPEGIDVSALDLVAGGGGPFSGDELVKKINGKAKKEKDIVLNHAPSRGPIVPPTDRDMHVTVMILPTLEKYSSTTRWGIKSREWKKNHDGGSYMVLSIKFPSGLDTSLETKGKGRRMRITAGMKEDELEREEEAALLLSLANGVGNVTGDIEVTYGSSNSPQESFLRGDGAMRGLGMGSWWKPLPPKPAKAPTPEAPAPIEHSPEQQQLSSPEEQHPAPPQPQLPLPERQRHLSHDIQYQHTREVSHVSVGGRHHHVGVELQPPEIEPLSSPPPMPEMDVDEVNEQIEVAQEVKPEVNGTWPMPVHEEVREPVDGQIMYEHGEHTKPRDSPIRQPLPSEAAQEELRNCDTQVPAQSEQQTRVRQEASVPVEHEEMWMDVDQPAAA